MLILGIETSCDETAASVIEAKNGRIKVLSSVISSQVTLHARWGGVVPSLAAREHLKNILPVIETSLGKAETPLRKIDLIAATSGPGLVPALLIGTNTAKTLAYLHKKPLLGIHHIEGHIYANFINENFIQSSAFPSRFALVKRDSPKPSFIKFPILCLVVSGGHTQLVLMKKHLRYKIAGETLDDAAGEAFDKAARILNLGYPGGPAVARRATEFPISPGRTGKSKFPKKLQNINYKLPRPMISSNNFNFSFSGLKTAVLYKTKEFKKLPVASYKLLVTALAHEFQQAVIDVLIAKTLKAAEKYKPKTVMLAGGVSANRELRKQMELAIKNNFPRIAYCLPPAAYSIDNAAMIAAAAFFRWKNMNGPERKKTRSGWKKIRTDANLKLQ